MRFRNFTCTIFDNHEYELSKDRNDTFVLYYHGKNCPDKTFIAVPQSTGTYKKVITNPSEISNAFTVNSYARFKGYTFQLNQEENGKLMLSTGDKKAFDELNIEFIDRGWYQVYVNKTEVEKAWEERKPSSYNLPMPKEIDAIKEILL